MKTKMKSYVVKASRVKAKGNQKIEIFPAFSGIRALPPFYTGGLTLNLVLDVSELP